MNLLKALFNPPAEDAALLAQPLTELPGFVTIEPLWTPVAENRAIVAEPITPNAIGRVKFQGTRWRAWSDRPCTLAAGTVVRVIGRQRSNILVVEPHSGSGPIERSSSF